LIREKPIKREQLIYSHPYKSPFAIFEMLSSGFHQRSRKSQSGISRFASGRLSQRLLQQISLTSKHTFTRLNDSFKFTAHAMHAAAWRSLRVTHQRYPRPACRIVADVRRRPARCFHSSPASFRVPEEPAGAAASETTNGDDKPEGFKPKVGPESEATEGAEDTIQSSEISKRTGRRQAYGSGVRRASRNKTATGLPPLIFPGNFWEKNVTCFGEPEDLAQWVDVRDPYKDAGFYDLIEENARTSDNFPIECILEMGYTGIAIKGIEFRIRESENLGKEVASILEERLEMGGKAQQLESRLETEYPQTDQPFDLSWDKNRPGRVILRERYSNLGIRISALLRAKRPLTLEPWHWYSIHNHIYTEIYASFSGELRLPPPKINVKDVNRQDVVLVCPITGSLSYLDAVVQSVATTLEADVIRLDAEDIAQIVGGYLGENVAWRQSPTALLGYEKLDQLDSLGSLNLVDDDEDAKHSDENNENHSERGSSSPIRASIAFLQTPSKIFHGPDLSKIMDLGNLLGQSANSGAFGSQASSSAENWNEYKTSRAMDAIIGAADVKRAQRVVADQQNHKGLPPSKGLIIHISGYNELNDHPIGCKYLKSLREAVKRRWYGGRNVVIVGTVVKPRGNKSEYIPDKIEDRFSSESTFNKPRIIYVPPGHYSKRISNGRTEEIRDLNIRHVKHMIRKLLSSELESQWTIDINRNMSISTKMELGRGLWCYDWVRRFAINMLGIAGSDKVIDGSTLNYALRMARLSEMGSREQEVPEGSEGSEVSEAKHEFSSKANATGTWNAPKTSEKYPTVGEATKKRHNWLDKLKSACTPYERKLLGGVIDPSDIRTTFSDVRTPPETIEALKTLTSLSLIRPDSFSYGVLANDKIPGVLLYGPPGTGKTLLAKAVAKESGATMLEVSASEINDMWLGESEKNVKALFSLAKKLAPCVVFIDEADAIFASRGEAFQRKSHREVINQFLREWDGMENLSAFIMVATNRPFDLDEAVLRRLPRRLLVDLPVEKDREAILQIHLKDESLDESISLATLAKNTPYYSGSDLKNLSVAAALACVREENEAAAKHTGEEPYVYPPKRILRKEHFDKAMQEISASISEDMSTLREIRKFDERYGDRKGRRKKKAGMGFGGTADPEPDADAGRVRKLELGV